MSKFYIIKDQSGEFRFNLKANNGEIILQSSEGYTTKQNCHGAIKSVKINAPYESKYSRATSINEQYYFTLKASNGNVLGKSEMYNSTFYRDKGIASVKQNAPNATTEDLTI